MKTMSSRVEISLHAEGFDVKVMHNRQRKYRDGRGGFECAFSEPKTSERYMEMGEPNKYEKYSQRAIPRE